MWGIYFWDWKCTPFLWFKIMVIPRVISPPPMPPPKPDLWDGKGSQHWSVVLPVWTFRFPWLHRIEGFEIESLGIWSGEIDFLVYQHYCSLNFWMARSTWDFNKHIDCSVWGNGYPKKGDIFPTLSNSYPKQEKRKTNLNLDSSKLKLPT